MANQTTTTSTLAAHVENARWATIWLVAFMLIVFVSALLPFSLPGLASFIKEWLFLVLFYYLAIEFDETARRDSTNIDSFIGDNGLALAGVIVGLLSFAIWFFVPGYRHLNFDIFYVMVQCTIAVGFDFYYGVIISQRIAFAGKERQETTAH